MQTQLVIASPARTARSAKTLTKKPAAPPPVILQGTPAPHPIYGTTPIGRDGFTLEAMPLSQLNHWHKRAVRLGDEYVDANPRTADNDPAYKVLYNCKWDILNAAFATASADPSRSEVDALLQILNRHVSNCGDINVIDIDKLQTLAKLSALANAPLVPRKQVGKLQRGRKLTRAGLLHRYQSFLIRELETIGWNLYGEREYPMRGPRWYDRAVESRCQSPGSIFFDGEKLPDRARKVLKSLRIDTERNDDVPARR